MRWERELRSCGFGRDGSAADNVVTLDGGRSPSAWVGTLGPRPDRLLPITSPFVTLLATADGFTGRPGGGNSFNVAMVTSSPSVEPVVSSSATVARTVE